MPKSFIKIAHILCHHKLTDKHLVIFDKDGDVILSQLIVQFVAFIKTKSELPLFYKSLKKLNSDGVLFLKEWNNSDQIIRNKFNSIDQIIQSLRINNLNELGAIETKYKIKPKDINSIYEDISPLLISLLSNKITNSRFDLTAFKEWIYSFEQIDLTTQSLKKTESKYQVSEEISQKDFLVFENAMQLLYPKINASEPANSTHFSEAIHPEDESIDPSSIKQKIKAAFLSQDFVDLKYNNPTPTIDEEMALVNASIPLSAYDLLYSPIKDTKELSLGHLNENSSNDSSILNSESIEVETSISSSSHKNENFDANDDELFSNTQSKRRKFIGWMLLLSLGILITSGFWYIKKEFVISSMDNTELKRVIVDTQSNYSLDSLEEKNESEALIYKNKNGEELYINKNSLAYDILKSNTGHVLPSDKINEIQDLKQILNFDSNFTLDILYSINKDSIAVLKALNNYKQKINFIMSNDSLAKTNIIILTTKK